MTGSNGSVSGGGHKLKARTGRSLRMVGKISLTYRVDPARLVTLQDCLIKCVSCVPIGQLAPVGCEFVKFSSGAHRCAIPHC
jgi:hypothetical protein